MPIDDKVNEKDTIILKIQWMKTRHFICKTAKRFLANRFTSNEEKEQSAMREQRHA